MKFFSHELAIDLGTANTVIFKDGEIVLDEPSVVAVDAHTGALVAVGAEAQLMEGKEQLGDGIPMMASGRNNILEKMLEYDILYISFISEDLSETCPGGYEAACLSLKSFKEEYLKHERDNYRSF